VYYSVYMLALKRLPEKRMFFKLAAQTNKRTQTGRGKRQGEQTITCSASASADTSH